MHITRKVQLPYGDMTDSMNLIWLIREIKPDEIYYLAAMSHVKVYFEVPIFLIAILLQSETQTRNFWVYYI